MTESHTISQAVPGISRRRQALHFILHFFEMCIPMCIGFAVGDLIYFRAAEAVGYGEPFSQLPELSVLVVTLTMTAPMVAWMLFRGMPQRATAEMAVVMPLLAVVLLAFGWLGIVPGSDLALLEHGLMMPVMLIPMFIRLDVYTGVAEHEIAPARSSLMASAKWRAGEGRSTIELMQVSTDIPERRPRRPSSVRGQRPVWPVKTRPGAARARDDERQ